MRSIATFCAVVATLTLVACAPEKPDIVARNPSGDKTQVAVVVGDESFTLEQVNQRLDVLPDWARARFATVERKKSFLATTVQFELLHDEAQSLGYQRHPDTIHKLEARLVEAWLDEQAEKASTSPDELRAHFDENIEAFRRGRARKTYILQTRSKARAEQLRSRVLQTDGALISTFRDLANTFSFDFPSAANRGLVGAVTDDDQVVPVPGSDFVRAPDEETGDFTELVWRLDEEEISQPTEMAGRWLLVIWSGELPPEQVQFDDVTGDVREHLIAQRRRKLLDSYRK